LNASVRPYARGSATAPIYVVDAQGVIVRANAAARELLGPCVALRCSAVLRPRLAGGVSPCMHDCPRGRGHRDAAWDGVRVRDQVFDMQCSTMGDTTVVTLGAGQPAPTSVDRLSPREVEVLALVAVGCTSQRVAALLGVSLSTARTHVERAREKLGARTRAEAVLAARRSGQLAESAVARADAWLRNAVP